MFLQYLWSILLTIALVFSLVFSGFILFVVITSQQVKSGTSILLLQLGSINVLLSVLFLALSTPSLIQGRWLGGNNTILKNFGIYETETNDGNETFVDNDVFQTTTEPLEFADNLLQDVAPQIDFYSIPPIESNTIPTMPGEYLEDYTSSFEATTGIPYNTTAKQSSVELDSQPTLEFINFIYYQETSSAQRQNYSSKHKNKASPQYDLCIGDGLLCRIYGCALITLHVAAIWIIVGLQCDKFFAIVSPLRYNDLVTRHRIALYSLAVWLVSLLTTSCSLIISKAFIFSGGACLPAWHLPGSLPSLILLVSTTLVLPSFVIVLVNVRILVIARYHQHRIFSAIFEVMMSAQATVTHQRNPFDGVKKKKKSRQSIIEQIFGFFACYVPLFVVAFYENITEKPAIRLFKLFSIGLFLVSPLVNSFLYGIKCKSLRKSFHLYLRKQIYKSEVKSEIEARIPSAQNSRRPSISSSSALPYIQKTLKRKMSDYYLNEINDKGCRMTRRSSDLSWHPLNQDDFSGKSLKTDVSLKLPDDLLLKDIRSASQYLTVPSFESARNYCQVQYTEFDSPISCDSEISDEPKDQLTDEEPLSTPDYSPLNKEIRNSRRSSDKRRESKVTIHSSVLEKYEPRKPRVPLLLAAYEKPPGDTVTNLSSPYILKSFEALLSIKQSQSLLKSSSFFNIRRSISNGTENKGTYTSVPQESHDCHNGIQLNNLSSRKNLTISKSNPNLPCIAMTHVPILNSSSFPST